MFTLAIIAVSISYFVSIYSQRDVYIAALKSNTVLTLLINVLATGSLGLMFYFGWYTFIFIMSIVSLIPYAIAYITLKIK